MKLIICANLIVTDPDPDFLEQAKKDLTVSNPKYHLNKYLGIWNNNESPTLELFINHGRVLELPRGYNISKFLSRFESIEDKMSSFAPGTVTFPKAPTPYDYQTEAADEFIRTQQGGVIAPCGAGKTEIGITTIYKLGIPTLILVHKQDLLNQWRRRIKARLGIDAGIVGDGKAAVSPITVATVQSLYSPKGLLDYTEASFYSKFGMVILDEAHHAPAKSWMVILGKSPSRYRLWLTATEKRKDGLGPLIPLSCGKILFRVTHKHLLQMGRIVAPEYTEHKVGFIQGVFTKKVKRTKNHETFWEDIPDLHAIDKAIWFSITRSEFIADRVAEDYRAGKNILVISVKSVDHCKILHALLLQRKVPAELLVGEVSVKDRQRIFDGVETGTIKVIIATVVAEEGLDLPMLDCIHLAYPMTDCEQAVGRVMRSFASKNGAFVRDYTDANVPYLVERAEKRKKFFRKLSKAGGNVFANESLKDVAVDDPNLLSYLNEINPGAPS